MLYLLFTRAPTRIGVSLKSNFEIERYCIRIQNLKGKTVINLNPQNKKIKKNNYEFFGSFEIQSNIKSR